MKSSMSTGRKAQPSAPRVRHSVLLVNQALRVLATATALQFAVPAVALDYNATTVYGTVKPSYPDAKTLQLDQTTQTAIQNITVLNTIAGERINIVQPNASALYVSMSRVISGSRTSRFATNRAGTRGAKRESRPRTRIGRAAERRARREGLGRNIIVSGV